MPRNTVVRLVVAVALFVVAYVALPHQGAGPDDVVVKSVDEPHQVDVVAGEPVAIWAPNFETDPTCSVSDAATGTTLSLREPRAERSRSAGDIGDWVTLVAFTPTSDEVTITCRGSSAVLLTPEPMAGWLVAVRAVGAFVLGIVGVVLLAMGVSAEYVRRRPPPPTDDKTPAEDIGDGF